MWILHAHSQPRRQRSGEPGRFASKVVEGYLYGNHIKPQTEGKYCINALTKMNL